MLRATRLLALAFTLVFATPGLACCMLPAAYQGDVDQSEQQVVVLYHNGHQEMIIRVRPFIKVFANENGDPVFPEYMEWVITVPNKPTGYAEADQAVFSDANALNNRLQKLYVDQMPEELITGCGMKSDMSVASAATPGGLDISAPIQVGAYRITEVKARGVEALTELNTYLAQHGYKEEDPDHMRWFVENEFTFLCIRITPPDGRTQLGERMDLKPLQVGFDTPKPYYPGKFSSQQGAFGLSLCVISSEPLEGAQLSRMRKRLDGSSGTSNLWTSQALPATLADASAVYKSDMPKFWYINQIISEGFNHKDENGVPAINTWTDDVTFALGSSADLPGDFYHGDLESGEFPAAYGGRTWSPGFLGLSGWTWATLAAIGLVLVMVVRKRRSSPRVG